MRPNKRCGNCRFSRGDAHHVEARGDWDVVRIDLYCHKEPPQIGWPPVEVDDWCGHWQPEAEHEPIREGKDRRPVGTWIRNHEGKIKGIDI